ncbi:MAG: acetyl-CoA synthetase [Candidatus Lokiarchaeota archaeon]|nr:acetyl-CoA synthetase [Candidatus Lokiarchaeota archaeon]MBD3202528.1 acetyl-CoA synthetase [Candidatus Lokiarchaeota archaeon]
MSISDILDQKSKAGENVLTEFESKKLLKEIGIPIPAQKLTKTKEETIGAAEEMGFPVVMKLMAEDIVHKSDTGAVKLNLKDKNDVEAAYDELMSIPSESEKQISVQEMAKEPITELIIGMTTDPQFGPALMFGIGGILVELLEDVSFRIAPITEYDAKEMIREIKGFPLLDGFRGKPKADLNAIVDILMKISEFVIENENIYEMDLNPVFIYDDGIMCVDARIILKKQQEE